MLIRGLCKWLTLTGPAGPSWSAKGMDRGPQGLTLDPGSFPSAHAAVSQEALFLAAHLSPEREGKQLFSPGKFMASPHSLSPFPTQILSGLSLLSKHTQSNYFLSRRRPCWPWCIHRRAVNPSSFLPGLCSSSEGTAHYPALTAAWTSGSSQSGFRLQSYSPGTFRWVRSPQEQLSALRGL